MGARAAVRGGFLDPNGDVRQKAGRINGDAQGRTFARIDRNCHQGGPNSAGRFIKNAFEENQVVWHERT